MALLCFSLAKWVRRLFGPFGVGRAKTVKIDYAHPFNSKTRPSIVLTIVRFQKTTDKGELPTKGGSYGRFVLLYGFSGNAQC